MITARPRGGVDRDVERVRGDVVLPRAKERGVYPAEYQGTTLREHLGLRAARSARTAEKQRRVG